MVNPFDVPLQLESITDTQLQKLCRVLWNWHVCNDCVVSQPCKASNCRWRDSKRLSPFFAYYKEVTSSYVPELLPDTWPALRGHDDIFDIIRLLKVQPNSPRSELTTQYFSQGDRNPAQLPPLDDQHRAFNFAVKIMSMVSCSAENQLSGLLELGIQPIPWRTDSSFIHFISSAFLTTDHPSLNREEDSSDARNIKSALSARRLKKIAGLRFEATEDLRNHLKLDAKRGVVEIYHYTSVLKEHLIASRNLQSTAGSLGLRDSVREGNLPRQLVLEVLDSVQKILFPFDSDSEAILRSLVSKNSFDPDCLRYDTAACRKEGEDDISYHYFGSRLMELYEEIENPSPRGFLETWLERKSGARYVMMATLIGVVIAITLGVLGLAIGVFQSWIAYKAWKYPMSNTGA